MENHERVERELLEQCDQVATLVECFSWLQRCDECIERLEELCRAKRPRLAVGHRQSAVARIARLAGAKSQLERRFVHVGGEYAGSGGHASDNEQSFVWREIEAASARNISAIGKYTHKKLFSILLIKNNGNSWSASYRKRSPTRKMRRTHISGTRYVVWATTCAARTMTRCRNIVFVAVTIASRGSPRNSEDTRVRDHCHLTGRYRGPAHSNCNLNYKNSMYIPIIFHNLSGYDAHFIIKEIATAYDGNVDVLPITKENYISFTKHIDIELNTKFRTLAKNEFEKNLYKLMNNAVFGKTMENVRNHVDVKLLTKWDGRYGAEPYAMIAKPNFHSRSVFAENLIAVELRKLEVKFNKPIYVGMCILDISKVCVYEFHHEYMSPMFQAKCKIMYTDTDSLIYRLECEDVYETMKRDIARFDTSDYPVDNAYGMPLANKKVPGLMKDENNGMIMTEFVELRAKIYAVRVDGKKDTKKVKGVKSNVVARTIIFDDYTRCLNDEIEMTHRQSCIRSKLHEVYTISESKIALSPYDDKRYVAQWGSEDELIIKLIFRSNHKTECHNFIFKLKLIKFLTDSSKPI
ncbi:hypothetical protein ALC57_05484 [Trachymyrmex cornetzi]|uniref:DNA-directed DNA polymerase n=1 Tax=Trachymyrmex cornetzi TaxID=471704 RepID=A0A151JAN0_9HYME|nr:hypothetical protein ALC57_05484 [Trachymyrmex cornetzi]